MSKKIGKYIGGVIGAAGALVAGTVLLPEIGAGLLLSGAGGAVVDIIVAACSNAGIAATTTAATAIGAKIGNEVDKAKEKNEQKTNNAKNFNLFCHNNRFFIFSFSHNQSSYLLIYYNRKTTN